MMTTLATSEIKRYGIALPTMSWPGRREVTRSCSIVPRSFSRTTDSAVDRTAVSMRMNPIRPGTRKLVERSSGLYQTRGS